MSRGALLSVLGLYNHDDSIFDLMVYPDGFTEEQKQITRDNILVECAELEFLYPAPLMAKSLIGIWSKKEKPYWNRVYAASQAEYNPIENYRRNETETIGEEKTEEHSGNDVNRSSGTDTSAKTGTETLEKTGTDTNRAGGSDTQTGTSESTDTHSGTDTVDNSITGYDSNTLVPHDKSETEYGHVIANEAEGSNTTTYGRTDTVTHNTEDETTFDTLDTFVHGKTDTLTHGEKIEHDGTTERTMLAYGNIGVTTSQEMLTQELELAKIINVIPIIIESFKDRFCLMVY